MADSANISVASTPSLVSIVIPCCGMLEFTRLCVPSVLQHSRPPFELIFLDVGSLDGTAEYLAGLQAVSAGRHRRGETGDEPADTGLPQNVARSVSSLTHVCGARTIG